MKKIKIAVIGGTGKSGKYLVQQLINQGFQIKLLLRNPDNFQINNNKVEIIEGNVVNYDDIYNLVEGCEAVISTLGLGIPANEPTIFSQSTINVLKAMNEFKIQRYIVITGLNVDTPFDNKSEKTAFGTEWMKKNFPVSTADKQSEYEMLVKSEVDWTLVRLPMIEQTDETNQISINLQDCPGEKISAINLANFLIEQLSDDPFVRKSPFIANS
ncbi:NAD(P)-dependent oxidoreductase [Flavobacterium aquicola]|uniref:Putative NADH-flavin reductase n=1 Tax=Flavobacterium aquicola TaxID=1682742 RepID=A0A3E0E1N6_9FLAO|nr:NAD(P)H-binding protein [Flavobacterium aquicola]REG92207.1 putative NADH-flavin reductase [Flavobacterium aquicola]